MENFCKLLKLQRKLLMFKMFTCSSHDDRTRILYSTPSYDSNELKQPHSSLTTTSTTKAKNPPCVPTSLQCTPSTKIANTCSTEKNPYSIEPMKAAILQPSSKDNILQPTSKAHVPVPASKKAIEVKPIVKSPVSAHPLISQTTLTTLTTSIQKPGATLQKSTTQFNRNSPLHCPHCSKIYAFKSGLAKHVKI